MKTLAIVTPTYNRALLLKTAFTSLCNQTSKDFVWYIIDDGSTDDTYKIVESFKTNTEFSIIFKQKSNGGKHTALNFAFDLIKEKITLILDSDDQLLDNAVETIIRDYKDIKVDNSICGLGYLRVYNNMQIIGKPYTQDGIIDNFTNQRINKNTYGDKCEVFKTDILKNYKFPEFKGEKFLSEATIWCKISLDYKMKFYNKKIYICNYQPNGLSDNVHKRLFQNPNGAVECYKIMGSKQTKFKYRIKYTIAYTLYSFVAKKKLKEQYKNVYSKFLYVLTLFPAWLLYIKNKRKYKQHDKN